MSNKDLVKQQNIRQEILEFLTKEINYLEYNQDMSMLVELKHQILNSPMTDKWSYVKIYENNNQRNKQVFLWVFIKNISLQGFSSLIRPGRYICFSGKDAIHKEYFYDWLNSLPKNQVYIYQQ